MDATIILAIIGLAPVVLLTLFRVNAATAFLALALGSVLATFAGDAIIDALRGILPPATAASDATVRLVILWLPVVLVLFFMAKTIGRKQRLINLLPAIGVGVLGLLLTVPLLTVPAQIAIGQSTLWQWITNYQALIVIVGAVASIFLLRMRAPLHEHSKHGH